LLFLRHFSSNLVVLLYYAVEMNWLKNSIITVRTCWGYVNVQRFQAIDSWQFIIVKHSNGSFWE
jgi:hypothetical protein